MRGPRDGRLGGPDPGTRLARQRKPAARPHHFRRRRLARRPFLTAPSRRGSAGDEGVAPFALEHRFACRITGIDADKRLGNPLHQCGIHIAVRREAAMTVAGTGPDHPQAVWCKPAFGL